MARIEAGEFVLVAVDLPQRPGWQQVTITHQPTGYLKFGGHELERAEPELREFFVEILKAITATPVRKNFSSWPKFVQKQYPKMIEREEVVYDAAKVALDVLASA